MSSPFASQKIFKGGGHFFHFKEGSPFGGDGRRQEGGGRGGVAKIDFEGGIQLLKIKLYTFSFIFSI